MLPQHLVTLVNSRSLEQLPLTLPANTRFEYQARFLPSGFDAAIEITPGVTRTYLSGTVCTEENAFTAFVANYEHSLARAYRKLTKRTNATVVFTGRWHVQSLEHSSFEALLLHVIDSAGGIRTVRYDLSIFDGDYHQSAIGYTVENEVSIKTLASLESLSARLSNRVKYELTPFRAPTVDGIAWLSSDPAAPAIFCNVDWPGGLSREVLNETLNFNPKVTSNSLVKSVTGPVRLDDLMDATRVPIYYSQIKFGRKQPEEPGPVCFDRDECSRSDTLLSETSDIPGMMFASKWEGEPKGILFRILV